MYWPGHVGKESEPRRRNISYAWKAYKTETVLIQAPCS
jgi:hypothetical protein